MFDRDGCASLAAMSIWSWLLRRPRPSSAPAAEPAKQERANKERAKRPIPLPSEPSVFECRVCRKVFEARRLRPTCPECDSSDVELMSA